MFANGQRENEERLDQVAFGCGSQKEAGIEAVPTRILRLGWLRKEADEVPRLGEPSYHVSFGIALGRGRLRFPRYRRRDLHTNEQEIARRESRT